MIFRNWSWRRVAVHDIRRAKKESEKRGIIPPDYKFLIQPNYSTVVSILRLLQNELDRGPLKLSVDLETLAGHIEMIGLAWSKTEALCIPIMKEDNPDGYWTLDEEAEISFLLYRILTHPNVSVVGQNFSYDAQYFYRHLHYVPRLARDTMLAQHSMFSAMQKSLDFLASLWCDFYVYWKDELHGSPSVRQTYNCKDCCITFEVDEKQQPAIDAMGLRVVADFQQSLFYPVLETMLRGIRPDVSLRSKFATLLFEEIQSRENWLLSVLGEHINIKYPTQMKELFYDSLGQKQIIGRKTGNPTCDDEALRTIAAREPILLPLTRKISELRSLGVFLSTFVNAPLDTDGRIRCSFNIAGTETYRFSSSQNAFGSGLNLQNIPKGGESDGLELPNIRSLFIPDPGRTFFDIDLSSADLRIVVWESDCKEMKALLKAGLDPYTEIAKEFYHDPTITKKDPRRQIFKSFAHGTNYLGTAKGLAERLGLSVGEAEKTQKWYFGRFPEIKKWQDRVKDQVLKRGMVENVFGNRMYFFERIEGTIFNQAVAWIPQSTVACLINRAYVKIHQTMPEVHILLQVHDSLAGDFPTQDEDRYTKAIVEASEIALPYKGDPLIIPVGIKTSRTSWGACG
jgi:DNA polymerase I-like protein with 3'-5' exonuclease and polymerase domains